MNDKYLDNEKVARTDIAVDIKNRKITRSEVERLCRDPRIKAEFFGERDTGMKDKREWNQDYLDRLSLAAVAERFNREYLLHLCDVAEFVAKKKNRKDWRMIAGIILAVAIFLLSIYFVLNIAPIGGTK